MKRRLALAIAGVVVAWGCALVALDRPLASREAAHVAADAGRALHARATITAADLALVRGRLALEGLAVRRADAVGRLALDVAEVRCELLPLGLALADGACRELAVRGVHLEASSAALFQLHQVQRRPLGVDRLVIDDAVLAFAPGALAPSLGRVAITIEHAEAGATVLRTPLSWIFSLAHLRARIALPGGVVLRLAYDPGVLSVAGPLFGAAPVRLPLTLPASTARDGHAELAELVSLAEDLAERAVEQRAIDWLRDRLR